MTNPTPHGQVPEALIDLIDAYAETRHRCGGIYNARTETAMFYTCVWGAADAVLFIKGRPHFHHPSGERAAFNSGAPICLIAYGKHNADVLRASGLGHVVNSKDPS